MSSGGGGPFSLWDTRRKEEYYLIDQYLSEWFNIGGTGIRVYRFMGAQLPNPGQSPVPGDETFPTIDTIDESLPEELRLGDFFSQENANRKYDIDNIPEMRGVYQTNDADFILQQMGIMSPGDQIMMFFHMNEMIERCGRKLMSGDVLELQHLREEDFLDPDRPAINKFYEVRDASRAAEGFDPLWWPHVWRCRLTPMQNQQEFLQIINKEIEDEFGNVQLDENGEPITLGDAISQVNIDEEISDKIYNEAIRQVPRRFFEHRHIWLDPDMIRSGKQKLPFFFGDGIPPNGAVLVGKGAFLPDDAKEGDYFLQTAWHPPRLFQKQPNSWAQVEIDWRGTEGQWTNEVLKKFINCRNTINIDGKEEPARVAMSKIRPAKLDD